MPLPNQFFGLKVQPDILKKLPNAPEPAAQFDHGPADIEQLQNATQQAIISQTTRRPYYQQLQVSAPVGGAVDVRFPIVPDRVYFYTTSAFALPLLIGPNQGFLPLPAGTYICLPGTAPVYWVANPNTAAITVTVIAVRDLPEFEIGGLSSQAPGSNAFSQNVTVVRGSDGVVVNISALADAIAATQVGLYVAAMQYQFDGGLLQKVRTPNVFKTLSAVVITTETTIWTPAAGKKFRLMGFMLTQGVATGAVTLRDNTAGATILIIPPHTIAVSIISPPMGNGILSAAANNVLTAQGASTETLTGFVFGTEE